MVNSLRAEAKASGEDKLRRMGLQVRTADEYDDRGEGHTGPAADGTQGYVPNTYADDYRNGEKVVSRSRKVAPRLDEPDKTRQRLDRRGKFAKGGSVGKAKKGTNINIVIAPQGSSSGPAVPAMPPGAGAVPLPSRPPGAPAPAALPAMPRKKGGRVYEAGAGSGLGRLEKIDAYGRKPARRK